MGNIHLEFNLLDEPWIRVLTEDHRIEEVSLPDALIHAHQFVGLAGEMPTQDFALLRLLLAILYAVFGRCDTQGQESPVADADSALDRWEELWSLKALPEQPVRDYLSKWRDRFWLFHPQHPFWQAPSAGEGTSYGAGKLNGAVSESENKLRFFRSRSGEQLKTLSFAEAARWLLFLNGFDDNSAKPKGKNLPSPGTGWLAKISPVMTEGDNLFETLLLNLVMLRDGAEPWKSFVPVWELDEHPWKERQQITVPDDPAALLTLQSRRLLLKREGEKVTGYALLGGDFFPKENAFQEQMTTWTPVKESMEKPEGGWQPAIRYDPSRQLWREFPSLAVRDDSNHLPGVVTWCTMPDIRDILGPDRLLRFRVCSMIFQDPKSFFYSDTFSDSLDLSLGILSDLGRVWQAHITAEIVSCTEAAQAVGHLAQDICRAAGADANDVSLKAKNKQAQSDFYYRVDIPFRRWLLTLKTSDSAPVMTEKRLAWQRQCLDIARRLGQELAGAAGETAFIGRTQKDSNNRDPRHYCTPLAYSHFLNRLRKIYKGADQQ